MSKLKKHLEEVINPAWNFAGRAKTVEDEKLNAYIGLSSEAGELLDILKKERFHSPKEPGFYRDKKLSEFGDVFYYLLKAMDLDNFTVKEVLAYNRKKLESRHPELGKVTERFGKDAIRG
jgi:NTP pyrophosphatase (non-canonical NTP hydrolase)